LNEVIRLMPDRIAFYSYAHVPWVKPGQRKFTEMDLPDPDTKRLLYETGLSMLEAAGYKEVGMDHFALQDDPLFAAVEEGLLHRNFMGYTTVNSKMLVGLGVSAISDCFSAYIQNEKTVEDYLKKVNSGELPFFRGHLLNQEDLVLRKHITNLMCSFETSWKLEQDQCEALFESMPRLEGFVADGLISLTEDSIQVLPKGQPFIRNICMAFDALLWRNKPETMLFSSTV
jgi:oxygen-independent coproporphyrinogen-3 oxidase